MTTAQYMTLEARDGDLYLGDKAPVDCGPAPLDPGPITQVLPDGGAFDAYASNTGSTSESGQGYLAYKPGMTAFETIPVGFFYDFTLTDGPDPSQIAGRRFTIDNRFAPFETYTSVGVSAAVYDTDNVTRIQADDSRVLPGSTIRLFKVANGRFRFATVDEINGGASPVISQIDIDEYNAAKAIHDACLAGTGNPCGDAPVDPGPVSSGGALEYDLVLEFSELGQQDYYPMQSPAGSSETTVSELATANGGYIDMYVTNTVDFNGTPGPFAVQLSDLVLPNGVAFDDDPPPLRYNLQGYDIDDGPTSSDFYTMRRTDSRLAVGNVLLIRFGSFENPDYDPDFSDPSEEFELYFRLIEVDPTVPQGSGNGTTQADVDAYNARLEEYNTCLARVNGCGDTPVDPGALGDGGDIADGGVADGILGIAGPTQSYLYITGSGILSTETVDVTIGSMANAVANSGLQVVLERGRDNTDTVVSRSSFLENGSQVSSNDLTEGDVLRIQYAGRSPATVLARGPFAPGTTQADIDAYSTAKTAYDECIAGAGVNETAGLDGFKLLSNAPALANRMQQSILLRQGSCLYDLDVGFPWDRLLGVVNPVLIESLIRQHVRALPFITDIDALTIDSNEISRKLSVTIEATTSLGESVVVTFNTLNEETTTTPVVVVPPPVDPDPDIILPPPDPDNGGFNDNL